MAAKMIVLALCVVGALGSAIPLAAKYPAGVNPHTCPNYPYCDNVAVAAHAAHGAHGAHAVAPYAAHAYGAYGHHGAVPGAAAKYPAGVDPHVCPNYPFCGPTPAHVPGAHGAWAGHAAHGVHGAHAVAPYAAHAYGAYGHHGAVPGAAAKYPAGVDPHVCPNYPFCGPTPAHVPGAHGAWAGHAAGHGAWAAGHGGWAGAHGGWAGAHGGWDDGSYHGDDGSYHGGYDDGQYHHWDDGSHGHWDDGSYHGEGHHHW